MSLRRLAVSLPLRRAFGSSSHGHASSAATHHGKTDDHHDEHHDDHHHEPEHPQEYRSQRFLEKVVTTRKQPTIIIIEKYWKLKESERRRNVCEKEREREFVFVCVKVRVWKCVCGSIRSVLTSTATEEEGGGNLPYSCCFLITPVFSFFIHLNWHPFFSFSFCLNSLDLREAVELRFQRVSLCILLAWLAALDLLWFIHGWNQRAQWTLGLLKRLLKEEKREQRIYSSVERIFFSDEYRVKWNISILIQERGVSSLLFLFWGVKGSNSFIL